MEKMDYQEQLAVMAEISGMYPAGAAISQQLRHLADQQNSIPYCAAILGESKRGKSFLVNKLLGEKLMPESVLPMTLATVRVEAGQQRVCVCNRDGSEKDVEIQSLEALMSGPEAEELSQIRFFYPSRFGAKQITLLDTPGLNDTPAKNDAALLAAENAQTVIMTISALSPLSATERQTLLALRELPGVRNILIVVTWLEQLPAGQQEAVVDYIRNQAAQRCGFQPVVLPGNAPDLADTLLELLSLDREQVMADSLAETANFLREQMDGWYADAMQALSAEEDALRRQNEQTVTADDTLQKLNTSFGMMDKHLEERGMTQKGLQAAEIELSLLRPFVAQLSTIRPETNTDEYIRQAISQGSRDALQAMALSSEKLAAWVRTEAEAVEADFEALRTHRGLEPESFRQGAAAWKEEHPFPQFGWSGDIIPNIPDLKGINVIPVIRKTIRESLVEYGKEINRYIGSWRVVLLSQNTKDLQTLKNDSGQKAALEELRQKKEALASNHALNIQKLARLCQGTDEIG